MGGEDPINHWEAGPGRIRGNLVGIKSGCNSEVAATQKWLQLELGADPNGFTRQMEYYETNIRREIFFSRKSPGHVANVTFQDCLSALLIDSIQLWTVTGFVCNF